MDTEEHEEEESQSETEDRRESTSARETSTEEMNASFVFNLPTPIGRGRPKLIRSRSLKLPGDSILKLHEDKMTKLQLEQVIETINEDPTTITTVDNNANENQIKTEIT